VNLKETLQSLIYRKKMVKILADEWEQEPKKKIKLYKYAWKTDSGIWYDSSRYYLNDNELIRGVACSEYIKLENDFIEVEDDNKS